MLGDYLGAYQKLQRQDLCNNQVHEQLSGRKLNTYLIQLRRQQKGNPLRSQLSLGKEIFSEKVLNSSIDLRVKYSLKSSEFLDSKLNAANCSLNFSLGSFFARSINLYRSYELFSSSPSVLLKKKSMNCLLLKRISK